MAGPDPLQPIAVLTYQALASLTTRSMLARPRCVQAPPGEPRRPRRPPGEADLARISAALAARSRAASTPALELARPAVLRRPRGASSSCARWASRMVLLDECHHLASLWGYVVRAVLAELGDDVHVIGLTATPPASLADEDIELYDALLGAPRLHRPHARRRARRPPRALPGARLADRAAVRRAASGCAEHETRFRELLAGAARRAVPGPCRRCASWVADDASRRRARRCPAGAGVRVLAALGATARRAARRAARPRWLDDWLGRARGLPLTLPRGGRRAGARTRRAEARGRRARRRSAAARPTSTGC